MWKQTWMMADRLERVIVGLYMTRGDGLYFIIQECHQERGDTEGDRSIDKLLKSPRILKVESGPIRLSARLHISWWLCKFQVTNSQKLFTEIWDYWSGIGMSVLSARMMIMSMDNQKQVNCPASWWNEQNAAQMFVISGYDGDILYRFYPVWKCCLVVWNVMRWG